MAGNPNEQGFAGQILRAVSQATDDSAKRALEHLNGGDEDPDSALRFL